jgi:hypothetical protein
VSLNRLTPNAPLDEDGGRFQLNETLDVMDKAIQALRRLVQTFKPADEASAAKAPIVTPWVTYSPAVQTWTNTTIEGQWRRNGDTLEFKGEVRLSAPPAAGDLGINVLAGLNIAPDHNKIPFGDDTFTSLGQAEVFEDGVGWYDGFVGYGTDEPGIIYPHVGADTGAFVQVTDVFPIAFGAGDSVHYFGSLPIKEWA